MVSIETLVYVVFFMIVAAGICALLWFAIVYCESNFGGPPMLWKVIRVVFVLLIVFVLISVLLGLIGHPIVRWK